MCAKSDLPFLVDREKSTTPYQYKITLHEQPLRIPSDYVVDIGGSLNQPNEEPEIEINANRVMV